MDQELAAFGIAIIASFAPLQLTNNCVLLFFHLNFKWYNCKLFQLYNLSLSLSLSLSLTLSMCVCVCVCVYLSFSDAME